MCIVGIYVFNIFHLIERVKIMSMSNESTKVLCKKTKYYLRCENEVNVNKVLLYCDALI